MNTNTQLTIRKIIAAIAVLIGVVCLVWTFTNYTEAYTLSLYIVGTAAAFLGVILWLTTPNPRRSTKSIVPAPATKIQAAMRSHARTIDTAPDMTTQNMSFQDRRIVRTIAEGDIPAMRDHQRWCQMRDNVLRAYFANLNPDFGKRGADMLWWLPSHYKVRNSADSWMHNGGQFGHFNTERMVKMAPYRCYPTPYEIAIGRKNLRAFCATNDIPYVAPADQVIYDSYINRRNWENGWRDKKTSVRRIFVPRMK